MPAYAILLVGVVIVVGGVLVLRLHAFLALTLAAFAVAALTPASDLQRYESRERRIDFQRHDGQLLLELPGGAADAPLYVLRREGRGAQQIVATLRTLPGEPNRNEVRAIVQSGDRGAPRPRDLVVTPQDWQAAQSLARQGVGERVGKAFGQTAASIGILIAMAAIIGKCLLDSGAADRIVRTAVRWVGEPRAPAAFLVSGFTLGIPVFFDTVFYLMMPLGKAMRVRTGRNYLLYILSIIAGATMAHSLVPPTPGPLLVASQLNVQLGTMIAGGLVVGLFTAASGLLFARWVARRHDVPLRGSADLSLEQLQQAAARSDSELPPFWLAMLPIGLPVLLISAHAFLGDWMALPAQLRSALAFWGDKNIALTAAAAISLVTLVYQQRSSLAQLQQVVSAALAGGGIVILITAAGGAFGATIKQTGVAELIGRPEGSPLQILLLAFLITAAVRTAQGSATVAMITAVGVLSGFADPQLLGFHPVYLALAIGCGSKPILWMNDSGFWVVCKMSGMTEGETLRYVTPMQLVMAAVGLVVCVLGAWLLPLRGSL